jgi:hypothetical protein
MVISEGLQNLLFNKPSAIAVPKFPPPMMAIFLVMTDLIKLFTKIKN